MARGDTTDSRPRPWWQSMTEDFERAETRRLRNRRSPYEMLAEGGLHLTRTPTVRVDVFYAPLDGSRIDYHPCGRPREHPRYIDPETGEPAYIIETFHRADGWFWDYPVRCGRCGTVFRSRSAQDQRGQYILHRCVPTVDWSETSWSPSSRQP